MFRPEFSHFLRNHAVQSKLASSSIVAWFEGEPFIFMSGYPMTELGFYNIANKAIFGEAVRLSKATWSELNAETIFLCDGLKVELTKGKEALDVVLAMRQILNWSSEATHSEDALRKWLEETLGFLESERGQINNLNNDAIV